MLTELHLIMLLCGEMTNFIGFWGVVFLGHAVAVHKSISLVCVYDGEWTSQALSFTERSLKTLEIPWEEPPILQVGPMPRGRLSFFFFFAQAPDVSLEMSLQDLTFKFYV